MLTVDSEKARLRREQDRILAARHMVADQAKFNTRAGKLIEDKRTSISNPEHQEGRGMTATAFMSKLRTINSNLIMEAHPRAHTALSRNKGCIYALLPNGQKEFIIVCEGDYMPEWTVMKTREERRPDGKPEGFWKTVLVPGQEEKRGYRTVLIRLIHRGLVSLTDVERVFGVGDRESWKILTGKGTGALLI